jgi:hypothetical protein
VSLNWANGRGTLVATFSRTGNQVDQGEDVSIVEELYAVDVIKDITTCPYFSIDGTALDNDEVSWIKRTVDEQWSEAEINQQGLQLSRPQYSAWSAAMKELHYHLMHGVTTYYETGFVMRQSLHGIRWSQMQASFTGINQVITAPVFKTDMTNLIQALPAGEWLYRPPQAGYLGKGRWRVDVEYQYAVKWSKVYGGTWGL